MNCELRPLVQAERQRQAPRSGPVVRGTFSPARPWRPAAVARLTRTLGVLNTYLTYDRSHGKRAEATQAQERCLGED